MLYCLVRERACESVRAADAWWNRVSLFPLAELRSVLADDQRVDGYFFCFVVHDEFEALPQQSLKHQPELVLIDRGCSLRIQCEVFGVEQSAFLRVGTLRGGMRENHTKA